MGHFIHFWSGIEVNPEFTWVKLLSSDVIRVILWQTSVLVINLRQLFYKTNPQESDRAKENALCNGKPV